LSSLGDFEVEILGDLGENQSLNLGDLGDCLKKWTY
jgi:hypothetical protein